MSRIPIRLRLTLAFALAMAVVLAATGAFLYVRVGASLDEAIDEELERRAAELAPLVERGEPGVGGASDEQFVRVVERGASTDRQGFRTFAVPVETPDGPRVLVVGTSLEDRDEALTRLFGELLLVGPLALLLASLLGYALARAALRPVESMRAEAAAISAAEPGRRLSLPPARDEVSRLGETLNDMLARLEDALERERRFVADASHELRTPLALLRAELELALRRPRPPQELEGALRSAAAETDRLAQLAEDLLVLARSDQGRLPLRRSRTSVRDLLAGVARRFDGRAETAGRAIETEAPEGLGLSADRVRLEQALGNLVDNALRHGGGLVRLRGEERDGQVELHVLDEGPGFPPEFLARAFERFSRPDEARSGDGVGLGLAIAEVIARAHGGSAHAAARPSGGADVWLAIPARQGTVAERRPR